MRIGWNISQRNKTEGVYGKLIETSMLPNTRKRAELDDHSYLRKFTNLSFLSYNQLNVKFSRVCAT